MVGLMVPTPQRQVGESLTTGASWQLTHRKGSDQPERLSVQESLATFCGFGHGTPSVSGARDTDTHHAASELCLSLHSGFRSPDVA
jgi:hypothetical protein